MPQIYLPLLLLNAIVGTSSNAPQQYLQDLDPESTSVPPTTGEVFASYVCMPDLSGEPALTGADGLVLLTGTDRPTLNCAYEPVLASTDGPVFTDTDEPVLAGTDEPAFIGTDGPVFAGTDKPAFIGTDGPVLASTDEPAFIGTDGPTPTSNSGPVILHLRYQ